MLAATQPNSEGWIGGYRGEAATPTSVGGANFRTPGTAGGAPPAVPSSGIIEARNNSGSNVRIPYARVVAMHGRVHGAAKYQKKTYNDMRVVEVDGKPALEYDHLRSGELAWILGRRFKNEPVSGTDGRVVTMGESTETQRYSHQAYAGHGVDRMQRLASTKWMQAMFAQKMARVQIELHKVNLNKYHQLNDSQNDQWSQLMRGGTLVRCADLLHTVVKAHSTLGKEPKARANALLKHGPERLGVGEKPQMGGIFVLETGPFLRGMQVGDHPVDMSLFPEFKGSTDVPRNVTDRIVIGALELELRRRNIMDWSPDGIVLSKLDSPVDEPFKSTELDARQAQLFNVAVQGPSITTAWTSDVRDYKLECQPMDKVFVCVVADLLWTVDKAPSADSTGQMDSIAKYVEYATADESVEERAHEQFTNYAEMAEKKASENIDPHEHPFLDNLTGIAVDSFLESAGIEDLIETESERSKHEAGKRLAYAKKDEYAKFKLPDGLTMDDWQTQTTELQRQIRSGEIKVTNATLTNFRLERFTSSQMVNYSRWNPADANSRLGLAFGNYQKEGKDKKNGYAAYIVGGWCIGTVLDSAASRSTVGNLVRTAPASMALNINVNIEWWNCDKLHQHFMNKNGHVLMRGQHSESVTLGPEYKPVSMDPASPKPVSPKPLSLDPASLRPAYSWSVDPSSVPPLRPAPSSVADGTPLPDTLKLIAKIFEDDLKKRGDDQITLAGIYDKIPATMEGTKRSATAVDVFRGVLWRHQEKYLLTSLDNSVLSLGILDAVNSLLPFTIDSKATIPSGFTIPKFNVVGSVLASIVTETISFIIDKTVVWGVRHIEGGANYDTVMRQLNDNARKAFETEKLLQFKELETILNETLAIMVRLGEDRDINSMTARMAEYIYKYTFLYLVLNMNLELDRYTNDRMQLLSDMAQESTIGVAYKISRRINALEVKSAQLEDAKQKAEATDGSVFAKAYAAFTTFKLGLIGFYKIDNVQMWWPDALTVFLKIATELLNTLSSTEMKTINEESIVVDIMSTNGNDGSFMQTATGVMDPSLQTLWEAVQIEKLKFVVYASVVLARLTGFDDDKTTEVAANAYQYGLNHLSAMAPPPPPSVFMV